MAEKWDVTPSLLDEARKVVEVSRDRAEQARIELTISDDDLAKIENGSLVVGHLYDQIARAVRRAELLANVEDPPRSKYDVILSDPPWQYADDGVGKRGAAASHYPTQSLEALIAMRPRIDKIAAADSMLLLWATSPLLPDALRLMDEWSFAYVSSR
jgi:hypothetical protein